MVSVSPDVDREGGSTSGLEVLARGQARIERHDWEKVSRTEYGVESAAIPDRLSDLNDGLGSRGID